MNSLILKYKDVLQDYNNLIVSKFNEEEFFFNSAILRMEKEMKKKKNLTKNFLEDFMKK